MPAIGTLPGNSPPDEQPTMTTPVPFTPLIDDLSLAYRFRQGKGQPRGLLVLLHGVGSNETSLAGLAATLPESYSVALVRSPIAMGPAAFCAFAVQFTAGGPVIDAHAAEESRQKLLRFVTQLQARTNLPPSLTLIAGFSQGGIMSASLALTAPAAVAGFAILSGRILPEIAPLMAPREELARLSALILHGEHDTTLPVSWAEHSTELLRTLGLSFRDRRYPARHEITPAMATDFVAWVDEVLQGAR